MVSRLLLRLGWQVLLVAAFVLLGLAFWIPYQVLSEQARVPGLAAAGAGALLSGRVLAVFHPHLRARDVFTPSWSATALLAMLRWALPVLSLVCGVLWFETLLGPPEAGALRRIDQARIEQEYAAQMAIQEARFWRRRQAALAELADHYHRLAQGVDARWLPGIRELERQLRLALDPPAAQRPGPGLEAHLKQQRSGHADERAGLQARHRAEALSLGVSADKALDAVARELITARQAALDRLGRADYRRDPRLQPRLLDRLQDLIWALFGLLPSQQQLVLGLALPGGLILELAIWVALQHLALAFGPLLAADYRRRLQLLQRRLDIEGELQTARFTERLLRRRVETARQGLEEQLHQAVGSIAP